MPEETTFPSKYLPVPQDDRIDNIKAFLEPTLPLHFKGYFDARKHLLGAEYSVALFHPEDYLIIQETVWVILQLLRGRRDHLALDISTLLGNYTKSTMSEEARFMENAMKQKIEYTQSQHLYQHLEKMAKRGLLLRKKKEE